MSLDAVKFLKIDGLPPEDIEEFICSKLGPNVDSISDSLFKLLEERAMGNPFVAIELLNALVNNKLLVFKEINDSDSFGEEFGGSSPNEADDGEGTTSSSIIRDRDKNDKDLNKYDDSSTSDEDSAPVPNPSTPQRKSAEKTAASSNGDQHLDLDDINNGNHHNGEVDCIQDACPTSRLLVSLSKRFRFDNIPKPTKVLTLLGSRLDRLNSCQQGILKVAAVILSSKRNQSSLNFKWSALMNVYPVEGHKGHLWKELISLEDGGGERASLDEDATYMRATTKPTHSMPYSHLLRSAQF